MSKNVKIQVHYKRPHDMGKLIVVGGPGGSGCSTIAKMLAEYYQLNYVYSGQMMRKISRKFGYDEIEEFLTSAEFKKNSKKIDGMVDAETLKASMMRGVVIDSKTFGAIASIKKIPCTVKIWLNSDISVRVHRVLWRTKAVEYGKKVSKKSSQYKSVLSNLMVRYSDDKNRYSKLYGIAYDKPELYYDIVLNTDHMTPGETFIYLVKEIKKWMK